MSSGKWRPFYLDLNVLTWLYGRQMGRVGCVSVSVQYPLPVPQCAFACMDSTLVGIITEDNNGDELEKIYATKHIFTISTITVSVKITNTSRDPY